MMVQGKTFAGWLARTFPAYRDRLIEDPRFFFKVTSHFHVPLKQLKIESRDLPEKALHFSINTHMQGMRTCDRGGP